MMVPISLNRLTKQSNINRIIYKTALSLSFFFITLPHSPAISDSPASDHKAAKTVSSKDKDAIARGTLQEYYYSTTLVRPRSKRRPARKVIVYTPAAYNDPAHQSDHFPVLYLLHGSPGDPHDFIDYGPWTDLMEKAITASGAKPTILVMPDGNYSGEKYGDSEWANSYDGRDLFEDFVTKEIVPWTDKHFRTIDQPSGRYIGGVSEGGFGSVNIALHHPDLFGGALALSGYYKNGGFGWARKVLGKDPDFLRSNSPLEYIDTGLGKGRTVVEWRMQQYYLGVGVNEKQYTDDTVKLAQKFGELGIPVVTKQISGKHSWNMWNQLFYDGYITLFTGHPNAIQ